MANDQTLSHFKILGRVGAGGMGAVFRAEDLSLRRKVALKFLLADAGVTAEQRARFLREARTAAALNHPNICTIHEVGEVEEDTNVTLADGVTHIPAGSPFLSMELIEGETLRERLERSPRLPLAKLLNIAVQVADGLAEAHSAKIVHRDLKPGNVMVTPPGRAKILDFGLAKPMEPHRAEGTLDATQAVSAELTISGQIVGTFSNMSPEQTEGRPVDSRSDIFAFGTLLYEMAAGQNPFAGTSPTETMAKVLEAEPEPLWKLRSDLPRSLAEIIERCLQKKPENRYADTRKLAKGLCDIQDGIRTAELRRWRRHPSKRVFALATVTVLVVLAALTVYLTRTDKGGPPELATASANRIAIFPFTVHGAEHFAYLSEGIVDLFGALLDGAGELRTVDPFALSHRMKSEGIQVADENNGQRLAEQMDASLYLLGSIVETEGQLQATCSLYPTDGGSPTTARASADEESQLYGLVETLVRNLLADRTNRVELGLDLAAETTESIEALKEYLRGENFRREGNITEAIGAYRRAVEADSMFALAWYALSFACAHPSFESEMGRDASARAMELRAALPQREQYLIEALDAWSRGEFEETERLYQAVLEIDPHCAKAWYSLGENLLHSAHLRGRSPEEAHRLMVRAIEEGMPEDHPSMLAMYLWAAGMAGDREATLKWVRRNMERQKDWAAATLDLAFLEGDEIAWKRARENLAEAARRADDTGAFFMFAAPPVELQAWVDVRLLEASKHTIRAALESGGRPSGVRAAFRINLAHLELAQGRLAAARAELERARPLDPAATLEHEALIAVGPVVAATSEELEALRDRLLALDAENIQPALQSNPYICPHDSWHPELRRYLLGLLSVRLEDFESAARYLEELQDSAKTPGEIAAAAAFTGSIRAHLSVARGDTAAALGELQSMTFGPWWELTWSTPFFSRSLDRYLLADLLDARGQSEEALLWFGGVPYQSGQDFDYLALCHRRRGEILERLGRTEEALEHYRRFLDLWQKCEPEYQPQLDEVRQRVEALAGWRAGDRYRTRQDVPVETERELREGRRALPE